MTNVQTISNHVLSGSPKSLKGSSIFFLGIGGIGMSAIARYFKSIGCTVAGYDKTETELTKQLISEGMDVCYTDTVDCIDMKAALIVYTPAIPASHEGFTFYKNNGYRIHKRSEVLGWLTGSMFNICIAGTHGKTTTSTMIAHILRDSGYGCNAFLGGISANYKTNFWSSKNDVAVAEADEYDRSFLFLNPNIAVITSMDPDHLDFYGDEATMQHAFIEFAEKVNQEGVLITKTGLQREDDLKAHCHLKYGVNNPKADFNAHNVRIEHGSYLFDVESKTLSLKDVQLNMGGVHNIENATAAISVAIRLNIAPEKILKAVKSFKGVKRRFETILKQKNKVYIDDYAHHPKELSALIQGVQDLYPDKSMLVVFQPHLYSRTQDFAKQFAEVLDKADQILLLPIYPARELPIEGVTSELIASMMHKNVSVVDKASIVETLRNMNFDVLVTAGAGDIDTLTEPIKNMLLSK